LIGLWLRHALHSMARGASSSPPNGNASCCLLRLAELVERDIEVFAALDTLDRYGSPISRTRNNRQRALGMLRFYAGLASALHGETIDNSLRGEYVSFTLKEPVGVVGAIIPWNGPLTASIWKIGPALATGCTVVLKPAEEAPLTPLRLAELCLEAGVPPGLVNVVPGYGETVGAALAAHPDVDKVAFTGSHLTAQSIVRASAGPCLPTQIWIRRSQVLAWQCSPTLGRFATRQCRSEATR
jgi:aldehyde dehydrogenase (NAD+)